MTRTADGTAVPPRPLALRLVSEPPDRPVGVLVVEDTEAVRTFLEVAMRGHGFAVWSASGGREAAAYYREHGTSIDLVLLDVRMPDWDGPETLAAIRALDPDVPCCFMSGDTGQYTNEDLLVFGAVAVFQKPFQIGELLEQLGRLSAAGRMLRRRTVEHTPLNTADVLDRSSTRNNAFLAAGISHRTGAPEGGPTMTEPIGARVAEHTPDGGPVATSELARGESRFLAVNAGSSSLRFAVFTPGEPPVEVLRGKLERPGTASGVIEALEARGATARLAGIGHRIVHGGPDHTAPALVTPELLRELERLTPLDPTHLPAELDLLAAFAARCPGVPQVVCFDTAFHRDLPAVARTLPIPRRHQSQGVRRYGFHGISYEYLLEELRRVAGAEAALGRVIFAHLGSGASLAAVHGGKCIDTTMGFTPAGGLVMGTRTGDLDPGVLLHLLRTEKLTADQLDALVNRESGLLGISETSADVRDLLAREAADPRAAEAVAVFCYQARKSIGAMAAALGGLDTLVFAGGIGENAPDVRARICDGLHFLGVRLVPDQNAVSAVVISEPGAGVAVRVIRTNEEAMIARTVFRLLDATTKEPTHG